MLLKPLPYAERRSARRSSGSRRRWRAAPNAGVSIKELYDYREQTAGLRRAGRVPPDELRSAQARRARSRQHRRRLARLLRRARHHSRSSAAPSSPDDDKPGADAVLVLSYSVLADEVRRRPAHRRPGVRDERPAAHRRRRAAERAALSAGERRLHVGLGVSVPRGGREAHRRRTAASSRALTVFGRLKPGVTRERATTDVDAICRPLHARRTRPSIAPGSGFTATTLPVRDELTRNARPMLLILLGDDRAGPADRVRERRQPDARAAAAPRSRARRARRARRRRGPARAPAAHREHAAVARRRRVGLLFASSTVCAADHVRRPLHRRARARSASIPGCSRFTLLVSVADRRAVRHAAGAVARAWIWSSAMKQGGARRRARAAGAGACRAR